MWALLLSPIVVLVLMLGPGLMFVRRMRLMPLERLVVAIAISSLCVYLLGVTARVMGVSSGAGLLMLAGAGVCLWVSRDEFWRLWRHRQSGAAMRIAVVLLGWVLLLCAGLAVYSMCFFGADWAEHYQRAMFWKGADGYGVDFSFIGRYLLTARPPLQNVVTAVAMSGLGEGYQSYVYVTAMLNALVSVSAVLLLPMMVRRGRRGQWILLGLLLLSPMFAFHATYAWTKLYCGFFVLASWAFYVRHMTQASTLRLTIAGAMMAMAVLVHYSAVVFLLILGLHYVWMLMSRRGELRRAVLAVSVSCVIGMSWFGLAMQTYGARATFFGNTVAEETSIRTLEENAEKIAWNIRATIFPQVWVGGLAPSASSYWGGLRERLGQNNLTCFPLMLGVGGVVIGLWGMVTLPRGRRLFAWWWVVGSVLLGVGVHGDAVVGGGLAQVGLLPLGVMGLTFFAANLVKRRWGLGLNVVVLLVLAWECFSGVGLMSFYQSQEIATVSDGTVVRAVLTQDHSTVAGVNAVSKVLLGLRFPMDEWREFRGGFLGCVGVGLSFGLALVWSGVRRNARGLGS